jgi:hypothetical protein
MANSQPIGDNITLKIVESHSELGDREFHIIGVTTDSFDPKLSKLEIEACDKLFTFTYSRSLDPEKVAKRVAEAVLKVCGD